MQKADRMCFSFVELSRLGLRGNARDEILYIVSSKIEDRKLKNEDFYYWCPDKRNLWKETDTESFQRFFIEEIKLQQELLQQQELLLRLQQLQLQP